MVGVRLLKKIAKVADALSADRSTAIRSILEAGLDSGEMIGLLRSGKGRGRAGEIAMAMMAQFKALRRPSMPRAPPPQRGPKPRSKRCALPRTLSTGYPVSGIHSRSNKRTSPQNQKPRGSSQSHLRRQSSPSQSLRSLLFENRSRGRYKKEN